MAIVNVINKEKSDFGLFKYFDTRGHYNHEFVVKLPVIGLYVINSVVNGYSGLKRHVI